MSVCSSDVSETSGKFVVRPNRSLTRKGMILFFVGVCGAALLVATRFWLLGAWIVLPITILELIVLGTAFVLIERETRLREVIDMSEKAVTVVQKGWKLNNKWSYPAYWVQVIHRTDPTGWYPSKLYLRSHGDTVEIGACLNEEERVQLTRQIKKIILSVGGSFDAKSR